MTRFQNFSSLALVASTLGACSGGSITASGETLAETDGIGSTAERSSFATSGSSGSGNALLAPRSTKWSPDDDGLTGPDGYASFVLGPDTSAPVVVKALPDDVVPSPSGFQLEGTLLVMDPGGKPLELFDAQVALEYKNDRSLGLQRVTGTARVPLPAAGIFQGGNVGQPVRASVGYELGTHLKVESPLDPTRKYLYFGFSEGLAASYGALSLTTEPGRSVTMLLDPSDPALFLRGTLTGPLGTLDDASIGFSAQGKLPFSPAHPGIDAKHGFAGHVWTRGETELDSLGLPLSISGETAYDLDPKDDGNTPLRNSNAGFLVGANGKLTPRIDGGALRLTLPLADATAVGSITPGAASLEFRGTVNAGAWAPKSVPLVNTGPLETTGVLARESERSSLRARGPLRVDTNELGPAVGLELQAVALPDATLTIESKGVLVRGAATASPAASLDLLGEVALEAFFNGSAKGWYLELHGHLGVAGVDLSKSAQARLTRDGWTVRGEYRTPLRAVPMTGTITAGGVNLRGSAAVTLPVVAGRTRPMRVTDAQQCGTRLVTDGGVCGTTSVRDENLCGTESVASAAQCGTHTVESPTKCVVHAVKVGERCVRRTVRDAARCGWRTMRGVTHCALECLGSVFEDCECRVPATCEIDDCANVCELPNTCEVPATCNAPRTCQVPATCDVQVSVPDHHFGTFRGTVNLHLDAGGPSGTAGGEYCTTGDACTPLHGGHLSFAEGRPEVCIHVPGYGDYCAPF